MGKQLVVWSVVALFCGSSATAAEPKCMIRRYAELPVTMLQRQPVISGTIDDKPVNFLADAGAFFSGLSGDAAQRLELKTQSLPNGMTVQGAGGSTIAYMVTVKKLSLTGYATPVLKNYDFLVLPRFSGKQIDGLIGQNILAANDTEYDLSNGHIRLFVNKDCQNSSMAYWRGSPGYTDQAEAVMEIRPRTALEPHYIGSARLNGKKVSVLFDTGVTQSVLRKRVADDLGIDLEGANVSQADELSGLGKKTADSWLVHFDSLELGGELIRNARLRVSDLGSSLGVDLILGADFFLSHRIYIANRQNKIYFTYNGGPVFDIRSRDEDSHAAAPASGSQNDSGQKADAAELRRRGTALLARMDVRNALASLEQAVALDPDDPENHYQLGLAQSTIGNNELAIASFDKALAIKPNDINMLLARGSARLLMGDETGANSDFSFIEETSSGDPTFAMLIVNAYLKAGKNQEAVQRLDHWIATNPRHGRMRDALFERCYARAIVGKEADLAIADCDSAFKQGARSSQLFIARGLANYRRADFAAAMADFQKAVKLQPKSAVALYGLGLAKLKTGNDAAGQADMKQATLLDGKVVDDYREIGIEP